MGFPFPYESFFSESKQVINSVAQQAKNPYLDLQSGLGSNPTLNWRMTSFSLWYELFFHSNEGLYKKISELSSATLDDAHAMHPAEFLTSCSIIRD